MHGLGLGLTQYKMFLSHMFHAVPDRPILIPLQPHVSQEIFNPEFFNPMSRYDYAETIAGLLEELGWAKRRDDDERERTVPDEDSHSGVTMFSHSKYVPLFSLWLL